MTTEQHQPPMRAYGDIRREYLLATQAIPAAYTSTKPLNNTLVEKYRDRKARLARERAAAAIPPRVRRHGGGHPLIPTGRIRRVAALRRKGVMFREIAERLGISVRSVERAWAKSPRRPLGRAGRTSRYPARRPGANG